MNPFLLTWSTVNALILLSAAAMWRSRRIASRVPPVAFGFQLIGVAAAIASVLAGPDGGAAIWVALAAWNLSYVMPSRDAPRLLGPLGVAATAVAVVLAAAGSMAALPLMASATILAGSALLLVAARERTSVRRAISPTP